MKKLLFISLLSLSLFGCGTPKDNSSPVAVNTGDVSNGADIQQSSTGSLIDSGTDIQQQTGTKSIFSKDGDKVSYKDFYYDKDGKLLSTGHLIGRIYNSTEDLGYTQEVSTASSTKYKDIDVSSFEEIGDIFAKDKNGVFMCGGFCGAGDGCVRENKFSGDISVINGDYVLDSQNVYYKGGLAICRGIPQIKGADRNSFEVLSGFYSKDKNHVYFEENFLTDDIKGFKSFSEQDHFYSQDTKNIYYMTDIITGADMKSFSIISGDCSLAKDSKNLFVGQIKVDGVDFTSLEIYRQTRDNLKDDWNDCDFEDKNHVYHVESIYANIDDVTKVTK